MNETISNTKYAIADIKKLIDEAEKAVTYNVERSLAQSAVAANMIAYNEIAKG